MSEYNSSRLPFATLIADAGSTKIEWISLNPDASVGARLQTTGINALMAGYETIISILSDVKERMGDAAPGASIFYYGAGCATPDICHKVSSSILDVWPGTCVEVESDLLGAARALLGHSEGIACILGTGSNSALYDGAKIIRNIPSLGFILGDEGSGASIGKRLVRDVFRGYVPDDVRESFDKEFALSLGDLLEKVYRQPAPNRFLASLVPFILNNIDNCYLRSLVIKEFSRFFKRNVAMYENSRQLPIRFLGSVAFHFAPLLLEAGEALGFNIDSIVKNPVDGLIDYHRHLPAKNSAT